MLRFESEQVDPIAKQNLRCALCKSRAASWMTLRKEGIEKEPMCAFCLMYMGSEWGHQNRAELLEVGRASQEIAARYNRDMPKLDERGRLSPGKCEQFVLGIAYSTRFLGKMLGR